MYLRFLSLSQGLLMCSPFPLSSPVSVGVFTISSLNSSVCWCVHLFFCHHQCPLKCSFFPLSFPVSVDVFTNSSLNPSVFWCVHPFLSHSQCLLMCSPFPVSSPVCVYVSPFSFYLQCLLMCLLFLLIPNTFWCIHHFLDLVPGVRWFLHPFFCHPRCLLMCSPFPLPSQWGTADAKTSDPSVENPELKGSPF